jgi:hypothetical protein
MFEVIGIWTPETNEETVRNPVRKKRKKNASILTSDEGDSCRISVAEGR